MRKSLLIAFFFVLTACYSHAQKQVNFWHFGTLAGIDFNSGSPVALTNSALNTNEGCSTISDASGNLLFYTDGVTVWDKTNTPMPNGTGLKGDVSSTQSALIVPVPGSTTQYYIFTVDYVVGPNGFEYSIVDMAQNGGKGDVTTKNTFIKGSVVEKLAGTHHCNQKDIWVMVHDWNSDKFYAYLITSSGINAPVISSAGIMHNGNSISNSVGQMKFSPDGSRIATAVGYKDTVDDFDFNNKTGVVSNPVSLALNNHVYGVEFSPDNSKLYVSFYQLGNAGWLSQFDLTAGNIAATQTVLGTSFDPNYFYGIQLAPDGKIYATKEVTPWLGAIASPNLAGAACNYIDMGLNVDPLSMGNYAMLGLPNFVSSYFNPACIPGGANAGTNATIATGTSTTLHGSGGITYSWSPSTGLSCANCSNPVATPSSTTTYTLSVTSNGNCLSVDSVTIYVTALGANFSSSDTMLCQNDCINFTDLSVGAPAPSNWQWSFPGGTPTSSIQQNPANVCFSTAGNYTITLIASNGTASDTVKKVITVIAAPLANAGTDATIGMGTNTSLSASGGGTYLWNPSAGLSCTTCSNPTASPTTTTIYNVTITNTNGCTSVDSVTVFIDNPVVQIPCKGPYVGDAFSPNGDGSNESIYVRGTGFENLYFAVYDRWGEKVFETTDTSVGWNGIYKGNLLPTGVYVYYLKANCVDSKDEISQKGNISLFR